MVAGAIRQVKNKCAVPVSGDEKDPLFVLHDKLLFDLGPDNLNLDLFLAVAANLGLALVD